MPLAKSGGGDGVDQRGVRLAGDECPLEVEPAGSGAGLQQVTVHGARVDAGEERTPAPRDIGNRPAGVGAEAWRRAIDGRGVQRGIHSQEYGGAASDGLAALDERGFHRARLATFAQHG